MRCLMKFEWVKLLRSHLPEGKGLMGMWARLASRAAFRKGSAVYCGHINEVEPGAWAGGTVGLKSILGMKRRDRALQVMQKLSELGFISYSLDCETKKLSYTILDWVVKCSGKECMDGNIYTTERYGFLCLPRTITNRLVEHKYIFEEADAWLDLWCHTVSEDPDDAFSFLSPCIRFGRDHSFLSLETLGRRWHWEKTKVWRFFKKYSETFSLYRLPGSYGCLVFNRLYPAGKAINLPSQTEIEALFRRVIGTSALDTEKTKASEKSGGNDSAVRVAFCGSILRAYISLCRYCKNCIYDCKSNYINPEQKTQAEREIRGP